MPEIIPAVLERSEEDLIRKVAQLPAESKYIHLDVLEEDVWAPIEREFEAHIMVTEPDSVVGLWLSRGAKRIIVHKPETLQPHSGVEMGLGIEMHAELNDEAISHADFVHLMSIDDIGAQGRPLDERIFDRIREVKAKFPGKTISVDGGINASNFQRLVDAGVDRLVVGSHFIEVYEAWTSQMKRS